MTIIFPKNGIIMDRLSAMALLVKVAELGSMSAAARALNMPLTTVSRQIGELENTLGVRLMIRTTRKLTLTDAGVDYVAAARRILEEVENAERRAAGEYQEPKANWFSQPHHVRSSACFAGGDGFSRPLPADSRPFTA
jgi:DNA-binding transcriptional LysR family regulator